MVSQASDLGVYAIHVIREQRNVKLYIDGIARGSDGDIAKRSIAKVETNGSESTTL